MKITKHIVITGRVQGVGYRASAQHAAEKMSITGNVKNMTDGSVEMYASGDETDVIDFINWCHNGPVRAKVSNVTVFDIPYQDFKKFSIL